MKKRIVLITIAVCLVAASLWAGQLQDKIKGVIAKAAAGASTISYSGEYTAAANAAADPLSNEPTDTTAGDILIAVIADDSDVALTATGWTALTAASNAGSSVRVSWLYRTSFTGGPYEFSSSSTTKAGIIARFSKTGGTWDASSISAAASAVGNVTTNAVSCADNSMLVVLYGSDDDATLTTGPADMTVIGSIYKPGSPSVAAAIWYQAYESATADITKTITITGSDNTAMSVCLDLVP